MSHEPERSQRWFENLPLRVRREVQRILDAEARRLLAERLDIDALDAAPARSDGPLSTTARMSARLPATDSRPALSRLGGVDCLKQSTQLGTGEQVEGGELEQRETNRLPANGDRTTRRKQHE